MNKLKHTPEPWMHQDGQIYAHDGKTKVMVYDADGDYIVKAVNSHEKLIAALQEVIDSGSRNFSKERLQDYKDLIREATQ